MMTAPTIFERVYEGLNSRLREGRYRPGEHLEPAVLANELNASITPVRDALQRLVGERAVEASPGGGFNLPVLTELGLRQLYSWSNELLQLGTRLVGRSSGFVPAEGFEPGSEGRELVESAEQLFLSIGKLSGSDELVAAIASANIRLAAVRLKEQQLLGDTAAELIAIADSLCSNRLAELRRHLSAYHRRRGRMVDRLVVSLQR